MGDFNTPLNDLAKSFNTQARRILDWEESGDVRILNDKQIPTHIQLKKGEVITEGLEDRTKNYKLVVDRE